MSPRPVAFIVRVSASDGLGHLVRSLSVIKELASSSAVKLVTLGDSSGKHLIQESKIPWMNFDSDRQAAEEVLSSNPSVIIFDTLKFENTAFERLAQHSVTVSLSPVFSMMSRVDHLFYRTSIENPAWATSSIFPKVHKGFRYTVLPSGLKRLSTRHYREQIQEERLAVAISMGGADAPNRTLGLLRCLGQRPEKLVIFVALGDAYTHSYEELIACASENRQEIILIKSNESMWRVLKGAALLLCAGGLTTYEAAYIGLPTINIPHSAEWMHLFEELFESGACLNLPPTGQSLEDAAYLVAALAQDRQRLLQMHRSTKRLIPSGGSRRIAQALAKLSRRTFA